MQAVKAENTLEMKSGAFFSVLDRGHGEEVMRTEGWPVAMSMINNPRNIMSTNSICVSYILFTMVFLLNPLYKLFFLLFILAAKHDLL